MAFNFTPTSALADVSFGLDLLASLTGNIDVVGIYNGATQLFEKARPMKATVRETSTIMKHPTETGSIRSDHRIINPVQIDIPVIIPSQYFVTVYQQIKGAFINETLLTVKTMVNVYNNMVIVNLPHQEDPDMFGAILMGLQLEQILYDTPGASVDANFAPVSPQDQNTVQNGLQAAVSLGSAAVNEARAVMSYASLLKRF